ncbi:MAG: sugar phosphate isomerase/epimerase [Acidobacteria bacterium]|nr:sugar phosphate isomerase/epimerase [Acidobacteriota bacterium]
MNRRDFLRSATLGVAVAEISSHLPESLFANPYGKPVGLQLYTLRDQLEKDVAGTIRQVADIGYKDVEIYSLYGKSPAEFQKILQDNGISASSGHYLLPDVKSNWDRRVEEAKTLGLKYMVNAILAPAERTSFEDYKRLVEVFNKAGETAHSAGIQFCYHNHNFEFTKYGDTTAYGYLLKTLDAKLVQFEMDCFWVTHAGEDPVSYFRGYPGRFRLLHIKDMKDKPAPTHELDAKMGLFAPVGQGTIDWKRIFAAARQGGMQHYYVEQDYCEQAPIEAVKLSYQYLSKLQA